MKHKYIVIITHDGVFNSILKDEVYDSLALASKAIKEARIEDKREGWSYEYTPHILYGEIEAVKKLPVSVKKSYLRIDLKGVLKNFIRTGYEVDTITSLIADKLLSRYTIIK